MKQHQNRRAVHISVDPVSVIQIVGELRHVDDVVFQHPVILGPSHEADHGSSHGIGISLDHGLVLFDELREQEIQLLTLIDDDDLSGVRRDTHRRRRGGIQDFLDHLPFDGFVLEDADAPP
jgi:hypothetical protein